MVNLGAIIDICTVGPLLVFWLWIVLCFGIARPLYRNHYKKVYGHYPGRNDVARWIWVLLSLRPIDSAKPTRQ